MTPKVEELLTSMLTGDNNSLAKLISLVENEGLALPEINEVLRPHLGEAYRIGITGPPGGGKSTLVDGLVSIIRSKRMSVGVVAVDPSSHISGGAVLGDRIRMQRHYLDDGVFIRSMATRGSSGGLSGAVGATVDLLDAAGKDIIIIETVGVGQTELDIMRVADTIVLVLVPQSGDVIQIMKAGLIEVADIIVVNKADQDGADRLLDELRMTLLPSHNKPEKTIIATQAVNGVGIEELYEALDQRRKSA